MVDSIIVIGALTLCTLFFYSGWFESQTDEHTTLSNLWNYA